MPTLFAGSSSALKLLVEDLLEQLAAATSPHKRQQQHHQPPPSEAAAWGSSTTLADARLTAVNVTPAAGEWQCQTAAVVVVLTEVLFGASAAWQAPLSGSSSTTTTGSGGSSSSTPGSDKSSSAQEQLQVPLVDSSYEGLLLQVLGAVTQPKLWGLPTSAAAVTGAAATMRDAAGQQPLPAQVGGWWRQTGRL